MEGLHPALDEGGHVLARLQGAQEADVAPARQPEGGGDPLALSVVDGVEDRGVHAVVGDVEP